MKEWIYTKISMMSMQKSTFRIKAGQHCSFSFSNNKAILKCGYVQTHIHHLQFFTHYTVKGPRNHLIINHVGTVLRAETTQLLLHHFWSAAVLNLFPQYHWGSNLVFQHELFQDRYISMLLLCNLESCCFILFTELYWNIFNYRATLRSQSKKP